jgi:predicted methyltransferase
MRLRSLLPLSAALLLVAAGPDPLRQAVDAPGRDPVQVARDGARHPYEVLHFLGVKPTSTVVEIWPGKRGYWTPILANYLQHGGTYYVALGDADGSGAEKAFANPPAMMAAGGAPAGIRTSRFSTAHPMPAPANSADFVLTFRNLHNWMGDGTAPQLLAGIHDALKPGGILGIEDHRAARDRPQDPKADDGYVRQDYAIKLVEQAGFKLVSASEIERNPRDTTHWPKGVWTLPPSLALGDTDRAKYQAIGEADNFLLKFRKVG